MLARPARVPERIWRWSKRNPVLASLWTALAVLLAVLTVGSLLSNQRLQTQNRRAVQAEKTAVAARNEAVETCVPLTWWERTLCAAPRGRDTASRRSH